MNLYRELRADPEPIVILGCWTTALAYKTLLITALLRVPVFIWADHPHPRQRNYLFARFRSWYIRSLARRVEGFLACGKPTVAHLESLGIAPDKITNFPYWVDLPGHWSLPRRCREELSNEPLQLLATGRQIPVKAFEVAIEAVAVANEKAGRTIVTLDVFGDGPAPERLVELTRSLKIEDLVTFSGWPSNEEVMRRLSNSDALVVPSRFEPYGVVVLEALASGRAVLSSDQVVAALDRDDGKGAIFFHPSGDSETLAEQIKLLADNRDVLAKSSAAARANAEQWPPARAAAILLPVLEQARQRRRQNAGERFPDYETMVNRSGQSHPIRHDSSL
ncbi:MAG TPA: glycosyltransferase family 4 protein [Pyrinomonadaceae bacterium]|nr:glycosyltransferase family 4 protein [Pyrinomonadaceae bacterium]